MKTHLAATALALVSTGAAAMPSTSDDPVLTFAACTGRLSAMMEHQWITDPPASEHTQAQRLRMIALLDAVLDPDRGREVLAHQIEAKMAQAQLLTRSRNDAHPREARIAGSLASREVAACEALLL
ncbi:hypothetical protein [Oceanicola sp. 22II-s10i]|uniref:hypothetical protein n=1 Tax=Oceanicola sp. 22II-s10i TaxID=1317116 RepID=UPI000B5269FA|nr:hypothetical protein [Oceanicola sp. 22II-s10i]